MSKRSTYTKAFKIEAVCLLEESDLSPNDLALELDIRVNAVMFLASDESSYVFGANLAVDGGHTTL